MTKKSELAINELKLLHQCTPEENTFQRQKIEKIINILDFKEPESDESANEESKESATKGHSTRLKANTPMPEKELTWDDIYEDFKKSDEFKKCTSKTLLGAFYNYLDKNYNCPTRKI